MKTNSVVLLKALALGACGALLPGFARGSSFLTPNHSQQSLITQCSQGGTPVHPPPTCTTPG